MKFRNVPIDRCMKMRVPINNEQFIRIIAQETSKEDLNLEFNVFSFPFSLQPLSPSMAMLGLPSIVLTSLLQRLHSRSDYSFSVSATVNVEDAVLVQDCSAG